MEMKKGFVIGIVLILCLGAAVSSPQNWQTTLMTLTPQWLTTYGYSPDSVLAYNSWALNREMARMQIELRQLQDRVKVLEPKPEPDPNEPKG
jgi:hypothetical protein